MSAPFNYFFGSVLVPGRAFRRLMEDTRPFGRGFRVLLTTSILWALTALALAWTGAVPMAPIFLPFRTENYYVWQAVFTVPLLLALWFATAFIVHVLGGGRRRGGTLKKTLGVFGFAQAVPLLLVWTVQAIITVLYGLGMGQQEMVDILSAPSTVQTVFLAIFGVALAWSFVLSCLAASVSQKVHWAYALLLGLLAEALYVGPVVIFLR